MGASVATSVAVTRGLADQTPTAPPVVERGSPSAELAGGSATWDLGVVPAGGSTSVPVRLTNPTSASLTIQRIDTSCECLRVELPRGIVAGHEQVTATATVDLSGQPGYRGNLMLTADGVAPDGRRLFTLTIDVSVR